MSFGRFIRCTWTLYIFYGWVLVSVKSMPSVNVSPRSFATTLVYGSESPNNSVSLNCRVSNLEQGQKVAWFKNNRQISENGLFLQTSLVDSQRYSFSDSHNLRISPISPKTAHKDSGRYECKVLRADDTAVVESGDIVVTINVVPREQYPICKQFVNGRYYHYSVSEYFTGDEVTLQCLSDPGRPTVILQWFRNDDVTPLDIWIGSNTHVNIRPHLNLTLDLSTEDPGAKFSCLLSQSGQVDRHCIVGPITIYDEPNINIHPESAQVISQNNRVAFTCNADTSGPSVKNYLWMVENVLNDTKISVFQVHYLSGNKTINLSGFHSSDIGEYNVTCVVDFGFSSRVATASLIVNVTSSPTTTTTIERSTTSMSIGTHESSSSISKAQTQRLPIPDRSSNYTKTPSPRLSITSHNSDRIKTTVTELFTISSEGSKPFLTIIASVVGGLGFLLLLAVAALTVYIIKSRRSKSPRENTAIVMNQYIEVNIIANPRDGDKEVQVSERISYQGQGNEKGQKYSFRREIANECADPNTW